jgi:hypothetical protein
MNDEHGLSLAIDLAIHLKTAKGVEFAGVLVAAVREGLAEREGCGQEQAAAKQKFFHD